MSITKTVANVTTSIGKFMARYAGEASNIADVFRAILPAVPINRQDKDKIESVINDLDAAADRIAAFLDENPDVGAPVKVKASDIAKAVDVYLSTNPDVLERAVAKALEPKVDEGNGNA